jgi:hypothetical protein
MIPFPQGVALGYKDYAPPGPVIFLIHPKIEICNLFGADIYAYPFGA